MPWPIMALLLLAFVGGPVYLGTTMVDASEALCKLQLQCKPVLSPATVREGSVSNANSSASRSSPS